VSCGAKLTAPMQSPEVYARVDHLTEIAMRPSRTFGARLDQTYISEDVGDSTLALGDIFSQFAMMDLASIQDVVLRVVNE